MKFEKHCISRIKKCIGTLKITEKNARGFLVCMVLNLYTFRFSTGRTFSQPSSQHNFFFKFSTRKTLEDKRREGPPE